MRDGGGNDPGDVAEDRDSARATGSSLSPKLLVVFALSSVTSFCASPVMLSGEELWPEERSHLRAGRGVEFYEVDDQTVDGRWLVMEPGTYTVHLASKLDVEDVNVAMAGIIDELDCTVDIEVQPGEEIFVGARMKTGPSKFSGGYSRFGFHNEISLKSSIEGRSRLLDTRRCVSRYHCGKANRAHVVVTDCD